MNPFKTIQHIVRAVFACVFVSFLQIEVLAEMSEFVVPRVIIGCWQLLERDSDPRHAILTLEQYRKAGFTVFDTADIYGPSEEILGHFLSQVNTTDANQVVRIFTKYVTQDPSLENALRVNAQSRQALRYTDKSLDLVQFHWWDFSDRGYLDVGKHLVGMKEGQHLGDSGNPLIRDIGVTNFDSKHLEELIKEVPRFGEHLQVNQVQYSLLDRRPENGVLQLAKKHNFKLTCFGSVAGGWLTDKFLGVASPQEALRMVRQQDGTLTISLQMYKSSLDNWGDWTKYQSLLKVLRTIADEKQETLRKKPGAENTVVTIVMVAAEWVLEKLKRDGAGGGLIIGVRDARHLDSNKLILDGALGGLSDQDMARIEAVSRTGNWQASGEDIWSRERRR